MLPEIVRQLRDEKERLDADIVRLEQQIKTAKEHCRSVTKALSLLDGHTADVEEEKRSFASGGEVEAAVRELLAQGPMPKEELKDAVIAAIRQSGKSASGAAMVLAKVLCKPEYVETTSGIEYETNRN